MPITCQKLIVCVRIDKQLLGKCISHNSAQDIACKVFTYRLLFQDPGSFELAVEVLTELVSRHEVSFCVKRESQC